MHVIRDYESTHAHLLNLTGWIEVCLGVSTLPGRSQGMNRLSSLRSSKWLSTTISMLCRSTIPSPEVWFSPRYPLNAIQCGVGVFELGRLGLHILRSPIHLQPPYTIANSSPNACSSAHRDRA